MSNIKNKKYYISKSSDEYINSESIVKLYEYQNNSDIVAKVMSYKPRGITNNWKKISKTQYINNVTGEIRNFEINNKSRINNILSIKRSQQNLIHLIRNNFSNPKILKLHAVLTFKETVYDYNIAINYWKNFRDNLKHKFKNIQFIAIFEFYTTGKNKNGIHIHLLLLPNYTSINRIVLQQYWKFGFVYLKDFNSETATYFIKTNTLELYPKGMRLYTKSKGIKFPNIKEMKYSTFQKKISKNYQCTYKSSVDLIKKVGDEERIINRITNLNYRKKEME